MKSLVKFFTGKGDPKAMGHQDGSNGYENGVGHQPGSNGFENGNGQIKFSDDLDDFLDGLLTDPVEEEAETGGVDDEEDEERGEDDLVFG